MCAKIDGGPAAERVDRLKYLAPQEWVEFEQTVLEQAVDDGWKDAKDWLVVVNWGR